MNKENKVKSKFQKYLNEIATYFPSDQESLNLISLLKTKINDLTILDDLEVQEKGEYPLPAELQGRERAFAIFSDGACRGNPGPGAWGAIGQDKDGEVIFEGSGVDTHTTNNRMELQGAIEAFKNIKILIEEEGGPSVGAYQVLLYSDSKYVVDGMKSWVKGWKSRGWKKADKKAPENVELWKELDEVVKHFWAVEYHWVKGHSGHPQNERCDELANQALDESGF